MSYIFLSFCFLFVAEKASGADYVTRCPEGTAPVETADADTPWACILKDQRYEKGIACPEGYIPVTTTDPYDPFKCSVQGLKLRQPHGLCPAGHRVIPTGDPAKEYECQRMKKGFRRGPRCPRGTRSVPTPGRLKPFRCVRQEKGADIHPAAAPDFEGARKEARKGMRVPKTEGCPKGTEKVRTEDPFEPFECVTKNKKQNPPGAYTRYRARGEMTFLYPKKWHLTDAWKDKEVPTIYLAADTGRSGRPVSITLSRQKESSPAFLDMDRMIQREKDWHGAKETENRNIGGLPGKILSVTGESQTAFLKTKDGYYVLSYSATKGLYKRYIRVYEKLLKSFRYYSKTQ